MPTRFESQGHYIDYLEGTLIPDLRESGSTFTAEDFEEAIYWIRYLESTRTQVGIEALKAQEGDHHA